MAATMARRSQYGTVRRSVYGRRPELEAYDGNAARVLEGGEILAPRPQVRPRERAISRPQIQVREAGKVSLFAVVGFLAVAVFAALVLMSNVQTAALSDRVVELSGELSDLQSQEAKLRAQYELAFDLAEIEETLTANGTMVKPQSSQIIYLDLSEPDSVVFFDEEEESALDGLLEQLGQLFGGAVEYFR